MLGEIALPGGGLLCIGVVERGGESGGKVFGRGGDDGAGGNGIGQRRRGGGNDGDAHGQGIAELGGDLKGSAGVAGVLQQHAAIGQGQGTGQRDEGLVFQKQVVNARDGLQLVFERLEICTKAAGDDEENFGALQALDGSGDFEQAFVRPWRAGKEDHFLFGADAMGLTAGLAQFGAGCESAGIAGVADDVAAVAALQGDVGDGEGVKFVGEANGEAGPVGIGELIERGQGRGVAKVFVQREGGIGLDKGEFFVIDIEDDAGTPEQFVKQAEQDVGRAWFAEMDDFCRVGRDELQGLFEETAGFYDKGVDGNRGVAHRLPDGAAPAREEAADDFYVGKFTVDLGQGVGTAGSVVGEFPATDDDFGLGLWRAGGKVLLSGAGNVRGERLAEFRHFLQRSHIACHGGSTVTGSIGLVGLHEGALRQLHGHQSLSRFRKVGVGGTAFAKAPMATGGRPSCWY